MSGDSFEAPGIFRAAIGGYFGPSYVVEWRGDELVYESRVGESQTGLIKARPTGARWRRFWNRCDELRVWD